MLSTKAILFLFLFNKFTLGQLSDRQILEEFYVTCDGDNWIKNTNWNDGNISVCEWHGITCTGASFNGAVKQIRLRENNLVCELPENLFYLSNLRIVDLSRNQNVTANLTALDPSRTTSLEKLFISDTSLQSLDGIDVFNRTLSALAAAGNQLTGTISDELLTLTNLQHLDLSFNFLTGTIPEEISNWSRRLMILALSHNLLSGTIPTTIGSLSRLNQLFLQANQLTGTIPTEMGQLTHLAFLSLNNQVSIDGSGGLTGSMIDFSNCPLLFSLSVSNNHLNGTVPSTLLQSVHSEFSSLLSVDLSGNELTGTVPQELARFSSLRLYLIRNRIGGVDSQLCAQRMWFRGEVGEFGCNAILCPPGTFGVFGRQISSDFPCHPCETAGFFGQSKCEPRINLALPRTNGFSQDNTIQEEDSEDASEDFQRNGLLSDGRDHVPNSRVSKSGVGLRGMNATASDGNYEEVVDDIGFVPDIKTEATEEETLGNPPGTQQLSRAVSTRFLGLCTLCLALTCWLQ